MPPAAGGASFPPVITHKEGQPYRQHFAPARCRSGSRDEVPLSSKTLVRYCAQLPVPDCKSGRVAHKVCRPTGRADPPAAKAAWLPPGLCLRRPGTLRPPVPQTGKVPVPRTVSSFLLRKKLKTGVVNNGLDWVYRRHSAPARCRSGSRDEVPLPSETLVRYSALLPEPD